MLENHELHEGRRHPSRGIGLDTLRHVFHASAYAVCDSAAIGLIMGRADPSMGGHYRERVEDSPLRKA
jgi:hypothetical protein